MLILVLAVGPRRTTDYNLTNKAWPHQGNSKYSTGATTDQRVGPEKEGQVCGVVTNNCSEMPRGGADHLAFTVHSMYRLLGHCRRSQAQSFLQLLQLLPTLAALFLSFYRLPRPWFDLPKADSYRTWCSGVAALCNRTQTGRNTTN